MRSSTLISSYLWKDTWSRWREQPSSVLARFFVAALLVAVAVVILVAFSLIERSIEARLENFGLNTLLVREMVSSTDAELMHNSRRPDRLKPLEEEGTRVRFRQLVLRAQSDWQNDLLVFAYPPEALPYLSDLIESWTPLICLTERLPEEIPIRVKVNRQTGVAVSKRPNAFLRPLATENLLLVPEGWSLESERLGFVETTVFRRVNSPRPMERYVAAIQKLYAMDRRPPPQIQSALPMIRELEQLKERQQSWRGLMALVLGTAVALVFGAIAVLEFRQNLYVGALLRSFGTPPGFLYARHWIENALVANLAALLAIGAVYGFHEPLFGTLGFSSAVRSLAGGNPYLGGEMVLVLLCVNAGAFLASLPVAAGLRRPVGAILN